MPDVPALRGLNLVARVAEVFGDAGALASALPAFESRPAQRDMAEAVAGTLESGGVLLVEAGTGTGKTLAYLVPAILSGERVLISTGTKTLQEQIYFKDLAVLREALGVPFTATYMKGRGNYLCLHRFENFRESVNQGTSDLFGESAAQVFLPIIEQWLAGTDTGDRAEIADLPEDVPFWKDISASSENCTGTECPRYSDCFVTRMRARATESNLVVVNHHLLCADAAVRQSAYGEVIPECQHVVVDEAHQLEDVATQYFGVAVSSYRCEELARDADRLIAAGVTGAHGPELSATVQRLRERAGDFFRHVANTLPLRAPQGAESRLRITASMLQPCYEDAALLMGTLDLLEATAGLIKPPPPDPDRPRESTKLDLAGLAQRAGELRDELRFVIKASEREYVYFLEVRGRGVFLRAAPIDVSKILRELLLDRMKSTVLTSATLTVDGSFDYVSTRLGVDKCRSTQFIKLPSEFDYKRQAILYLPRQMPDPRSVDFTRGRGTRNPGDSRGEPRTRLRALHELRRAARGPGHRGGGASLSGARAGDRAPLGAARAVSDDPQLGPAGDVELLAGRRRDGRSAQLRHHRQAAICLAGRPHYRRPHRRDRRARRPALFGVPGAARHPLVASGPGQTPSSSGRPRRPGRARSPAADDGVREALPCVDAARARHARHRGDPPLFRRELAIWAFV